MILVEFLTAQLDDRQRQAEQAERGGDGRWTVGSHEIDQCRIEGDQIEIYDEGGHTAEQAAFIAANDPAFVLADIAAKRKIIERCQRLEWLAEVPSHYAMGLHLLAEDVLRFLAAPFADRPGYNEAWRP